MFASYEWPTAECIVDHEGGWGAPVYNHAGSGAAGPFQWMPSTWPSVSAAAGYAGWSVLNIEANVGSAAHYAHSHADKWYPWRAFASYYCPGW